MEKILFCTDLSDNCKGVLNYISDWVKGKNYIVDVIHAYDPNMVIFSSINIMKTSDIQKEMIQKMHNHLNEYISLLPKANRGKTHLLADSNFSEALIAKSKDLGVDIIVAGLRQKYTLLDRFFGSTTARLVEDSDIPVLVVPYLRTYAPYQHILFPTAISSGEAMTSNEENALEWIENHLTSETQRKIHLLHIDNNHDKVEEKIDNYLSNETDYTRSYAADVATGVIDYLERNGVDLLAIYRPAKSTWEKIYKSSVAKKLLFKTHLPILFL